MQDRCMAQSSKRSPRSSRSRRAGDRVLQGVAVAAQMGLLCPQGIDELMRRELGVKEKPDFPPAR